MSEAARLISELESLPDHHSRKCFTVYPFGVADWLTENKQLLLALLRSAAVAGKEREEVEALLRRNINLAIALRRSVQSHESLGAMLKDPGSITEQGWKAMQAQCSKYAAEGREALGPTVAASAHMEQHVGATDAARREAGEGSSS